MVSEVGSVGGSSLILQSVAFLSTVLISLILLQLVLHARRLHHLTGWRLLIGVGPLTLSLGALGHVTALWIGFPPMSFASLAPMAASFAGLGFVPAIGMGVWTAGIHRGTHVSSASVWLFRMTLVSGCAFLALLTAVVCVRPGINPNHIAEAVAAVNLVLFLAAALVLHREKPGLHGARLFLIFSIVGTMGIAFIAGVRDYYHVPIGTGKSLLALAFASALFLYFATVSAFADFRFADAFLRRSLRVGIAAILGMAACFGLEALRGRQVSEAAHGMAVTVVVAAVMLLSPELDSMLEILVHRCIFRQPDDAAAARHRWKLLISVGTEDEVFASAERRLHYLAVACSANISSRENIRRTPSARSLGRWGSRGPVYD
jgi:hypothetical protein